MPAPRIGLVAWWMALAAARLATAADEPSATFRDGFESARTAWRQEETDATVNLLAHDRSEATTHDGRRSEHFKFTAQAGSAFYYSYRLPKVPLTRDLEASLYVRSDRAGVQLLGRVVLPADTDPETGQPSFVTIPGTVSDTAGRWQRLELTDIPRAVERAARVLRAGTQGRRAVSLEGAYLERLVVNLYGGPGDAEVFLDDLAVSPVPDEAVVAADGNLRAPDPNPPAAAATAGKAGVRLDGNRLNKDGFDWIPSIIAAPGADLEVLRLVGPDVLALDLDADPQLAREAVRLGFQLMPRVESRVGEGARSPTEVLADAAAYPFRDKVAFWDLGTGLGASRDAEDRKAELTRVRDLGRVLRGGPDGAGRPTTGTVAGLFRPYSQAGRGLDLIGVEPAAWGTVQDPLDTYRYLDQRRNLTALDRPLGLFWAWVPAATPPEFRAAIWGRDVPPTWGDPQVQPEQVRMYAFAALMAGYRGLGFRGDADLTREAGTARRCEIALINAEVDLIESILAQGSDPITLLRTFPPDQEQQIVFNPMGIGLSPGSRSTAPPPGETAPHESIKAAVIDIKDRSGRLVTGKLLLVADLAAGAQWQPPQMALAKLKIRAQLPESAQAWEIGLGEVRHLESKRVPGGRDITVPEFGGTAILLVTIDEAMVHRLEAEVQRVRPWAIPLAIKQAQHQLDRVVEIHNMLVRDGHVLLDKDGKKPTKDEAKLLEQARETLRSAEEALARQDYPTAWAEARRVGRPLRILLRAYFDQAVKDLDAATKDSLGVPDPKPDPKRSVASRRDKTRPRIITTPVASPPLVAFNTLPKHYDWLEWVRRYDFGPNLLPVGSFEEPDALKQDGWVAVGYANDELQTSVATKQEKGWNKGRFLALKAGPAASKKLDDVPPFQDHPVVAVRTPPIRVGARQLIRIRVFVKMPRVAPPGNGGLIVCDSLGGEALQYRSTAAIPSWRELVLYRRVPADGTMTVTLGLAATVGEAYFDELRVEQAIDAPAPPPGRPSPPEASPVASRPSPRPRAPAARTATRPDAPARSPR
jgi:hypothetical protein